MVRFVRNNFKIVLAGVMLAAVMPLGGCALVNLGQNVVNALIGGCCNFDVWSVGL
jgi:hypothetical protein